MIYKFWDMITSDDLEFSVANVEQPINEFGVGADDEKRSSMFSKNKKNRENRFKGNLIHM